MLEIYLIWKNVTDNRKKVFQLPENLITLTSYKASKEKLQDSSFWLSNYSQEGIQEYQTNMFIDKAGHHNHLETKFQSNNNRPSWHQTKTNFTQINPKFV